MKRKLSILLAFVMLFTLVVPAFAYTDGHVSYIPTVQNDGKYVLGTLLIEEDSDYKNDLQGGKTFKMSLPSSVDWVYNPGNSVTTIVYVDGTDVTASNVTFNDEDAYVTLPASLTNDNTQNKIEIVVAADVDGYTGDVEVTIDGRESGVSSGKFVVGRAYGDECTVVALDKEVIGETGKTGKIEITENALGTLIKDTSALDLDGDGTDENIIEKIELTLPNDFKWDKTNFTTSDVTVIGDFTGNTVNKDVKFDGDRKAIVYLYGAVSAANERAVIQITPEIIADKDADYGDVEITVEGDNIDQTDVVVAEYADWGVKLDVIDEVPTVLAGTFDEGNGEELATIKLKENVAGSLVQGRKIEFEFDESVKIVKAKIENVSGTANVLPEGNNVQPSGDRNELTLTVNTASTDAVEYEITFYGSVEADYTGDIVVDVSGSANVEGELVIGKVVAPVTVEGETVDLTLGTQEQVLGDIIITEYQDEAIIEDQNIEIELPDGVSFAGTPKVEVVEGNLDLDEEGIEVDDTLTSNDSKLVIPVKGESTKASTVKISDVKVTIDRTVPYGPIVAKIKGAALVENYLDGARDTDKEFDENTVVKVVVGNLVTPVQGAKGGAAEFRIGSTLYSIAGETKIADVAPYVKDGRTYTPVRYVAEAVGVDAVDYDAATKTVTLTKGEDVVTLVIGSNIITVNGEAAQMDVAPEVTNGRTMLPARFVAEAFGAQVGYDPLTKTVAIIQ